MRLLLRAFPARFRRRYGTELLELADAGGSPVRDGANILLAGLRLRLDDAAARLRWAHGLSVGMVAAVVGSAALGGCVVLGSAGAGLGGILVGRRAPYLLASLR